MRTVVLVMSLVLIPFAVAPMRADSGSTPISYEIVSINIEGSVWSGVDSMSHAYTFRFLKDGILNYTSPSGTYQNGTWTQHGANVYMEMNGKFAEYRGVVKGEHIVGQAGNIRGLRWSWRVQRKREADK